MTEHLSAEKQAILAQALPDTPFDGWTEAVLLRATRAAGYDAAMAMRAFPAGVADLLDFFVRDADRGMLEALAARDVKAMRLRDRVALAIRLRLEAHIADREAVRKAVAALALPHRVPLALKQLHRTVDAI